MVKQHVSFGATTTAMQMYIDKKNLNFKQSLTKKENLKIKKILQRFITKILKFVFSRYLVSKTPIQYPP
jgi:hypothetical protein